MITWKAFEYTLLLEFYDRLKNITNIQIKENDQYKIAKNCFETTNQTHKEDCKLASSFAVNFLIDLEPRLSNDLWKDDILELEILSDENWKQWDVRDILVIRKLQYWEIWVSAKNNHDAAKHSRLSHKLDFWEKWLWIPSSKEYFEKISPIFTRLEKIQKESKKTTLWKDIWDYHTEVYLPILSAFKEELLKLYHLKPSETPEKLISYLIWRKDFYKVIKSKGKVDILAFNLYWTLNQNFKDKQAKFRVQKVDFPTKIEKLEFKQSSKSTLILILDKEWEISFRIHNASSRVEPSLKFDVQILKRPKTLYRNTLNILK